MPKMKVPVEFVFEVSGPIPAAQQRIREQINTDMNDYHQFPHSNAELISIEIKEMKLVE
ncbi:hypothetical protein LCGC14_0688180 [marine sediment metagenome]|uniref:Uncharacterized protein n=1 Tax=marine sediment metagenome TaxID=412755 RepID=A0A0F9QLA0_9ZZZZ